MTDLSKDITPFADGISLKVQSADLDVPKIATSILFDKVGEGLRVIRAGETESKAITAGNRETLKIASARTTATVSSGWTVSFQPSGIAYNFLAQSLTSKALFHQLPAMKVGDKLDGFQLSGKMLSAGNSCALLAELVKHTGDPASGSETVLGSFSLAKTADFTLDADTAKLSGLDETIDEESVYYVRLTGTTGASCSIGIGNVAVTTVKQ